MRKNEIDSLKIIAAWLVLLLAFPLITYRKLLIPMDEVIVNAGKAMKVLQDQISAMEKNNSKLLEFQNRVEALEKKTENVFSRIPDLSELAEFSNELKLIALNSSVEISHVEFMMPDNLVPGKAAIASCLFAYTASTAGIDEFITSFGRRYPLTGVNSFTLGPVRNSGEKANSLLQPEETGRIVLEFMITCREALK
ncbi:MAG: hypothetical protein CVV64_04025 [Candidatus Wallbacteria bacterium HGW-Wallbacteria-1]|uniref:Uncharacterized protein n=1 Tax=Candidatus Wallbacteria bacterium HGW-Wallbacteria-1 TaxID=2013854 RepID=A0A2N1PRH5_9BACT|nr:MAG: hypothetical protein CVV64_04025 [Candidatus Wallbacteria bacterium HGW-Wallbacteria-1]